jgi:hypothetical protein
MKSFSLALLASTLANAIELPRAEAEGFTLEQYESGFVHEKLMDAKMVSSYQMKEVYLTDMTSLHSRNTVLRANTNQSSIQL